MTVCLTPFGRCGIYDLEEICLGTLLPHLLTNLAILSNVAKSSLSRHTLPWLLWRMFLHSPLLLLLPSLFCTHLNASGVLIQTSLWGFLPKPSIHAHSVYWLQNHYRPHIPLSWTPSSCMWRTLHTAQMQPGTAEFISFPSSYPSPPQFPKPTLLWWSLSCKYCHSPCSCPKQKETFHHLYCVVPGTHSVAWSWPLTVLVFIVSLFISLPSLFILLTPFSWTTTLSSKLLCALLPPTHCTLWRWVASFLNHACHLCPQSPALMSSVTFRTALSPHLTYHLTELFMPQSLLPEKCWKYFSLPIFFGCCILTTTTTTKQYGQCPQFNSNTVMVHSDTLYPSKISPRLLILSKVSNFMRMSK